MRKWFWSDADNSNKNVKWEKYPFKVYYSWAAISVLLVVVIAHYNLSIPRFAVMVYFGIFVALHFVCRKYIGLPLNRPDPSNKEIVKLWLQRIDADGRVSEKDKQDVLTRKISRQLFLVRICVLITGITMFFLMFWPIFGSVS